MKKTCGIILAAGSGRRMGTEIEKQFLPIEGKPLLYYSIKAFEDSEIDEIVIVSSKERKQFCKDEIVDKYKFEKVSKIVIGGKERYYSVANALDSISQTAYVLIHDGARPMITPELINENIDKVKEGVSCVTAVLAKDTIKEADENKIIIGTIKRSRAWLAQTPQTFEYELIKNAYQSFLKKENKDATDDSMILELYIEETKSSHHIELIEGSYENIKITTSEDLYMARKLLQEKREKSQNSVDMKYV